MHLIFIISFRSSFSAIFVWKINHSIFERVINETVSIITIKKKSLYLFYNVSLWSSDENNFFFKSDERLLINNKITIKSSSLNQAMKSKKLMEEALFYVVQTKVATIVKLVLIGCHFFGNHSIFFLDHWFSLLILFQLFLFVDSNLKLAF